MSKLQSSLVNWNIKAVVECPHCGVDHNFMDIDEWWVYCEIGEEKELFHIPVVINCNSCKEDFEVNGSTY